MTRLLGQGVVGAFGFVGIAGLFASPWIGRAVDVLTMRPVLAGGAAAMLLAFVLLGGTTWHPMGLVLAMVVIDVGNRAGLISNQSRIYGLSGGARSRLNTIFMTSYFAGGAMGTAVAASTVARFGWSGLVATGMSFSAAALAGHLLLDRRRQGVA